MEYYIDEPATLEEYNIRYNENIHFFNDGDHGTQTRLPCPFCAEPDWIIHGVFDAQRLLAQGATCKRCHRGARMIFAVDAPNALFGRLVQTEGLDAPSFLPPIERA